jgi:two-component system, cell cycle sensor histidine kinase PleC
VRDFMDQDTSSHFEMSFQVAIKQRMPVTIQAFPIFPGGQRINGFWVNPVFSADGSVDILDVMAQPDITPESILQRERDDAVTLLTSIFDTSEISIIVTDHHRRLLRINDSFVRTYGWPREQVIGEDFATLVSPEEQDSIKSGHASLVQSGLRSTGEMRMMRGDGSIANTLYTTATLELSQRRRFLIMTIMDITLRKQMEISLRIAKDQADAANQAKSAFLANMSHELRTPLNAIIGFSELMLKKTFGPLGHVKYGEYLEDVHVSARHLLDIINEVLDMSKIEAGRVDLEESDIDLMELIPSVVRIMDSRAFSAGISIGVDMPSPAPMLRGDHRLLRQILINLLSNAVKYSNNGGAIEVKIALEIDGKLQMMVRDHGIGIPKHKIPEALEPFGQINDPSHAGGNLQGTGLGLPLAKAMTELHGGYLHLESDLGQGTSVYLTFPANRVILES